MRVWLAILVLGVLVAGGTSVYLVQHPPHAGGADAAPSPPPQEEAPRGPLGEATPIATPAPDLAPPGLEPGIVPDPDAPIFPPPEAPLGEPDAAGDAAAGEPPVDVPEDAADPPADGDDPPQDDPGDAPDEGDDPPPEEPPAPPEPRSWTWTHDYRTEGPAPAAFDVPAGLRQLEFRVVFSAQPAALPALAAVSATLVAPDGVAKVPCSSSGLLVGQVACGPFRTDALPGRWEVQYAGSGGVTATLTLAELA